MANEELTGQVSPRISQKEAEEVVALHTRLSSEGDQEAASPSIKDLAEALGSTEDRVIALLAEVRQANQGAQTPATLAEAPRRKWLNGKAVAAMLLVAMAGATAGGIALYAHQEQVRLASPEHFEHLLRHERPGFRSMPYSLPPARKVTLDLGDGAVTELSIPWGHDGLQHLTSELNRIAQTKLRPKGPLPSSPRDEELRVEEWKRALALGSNVGFEKVYTLHPATLSAGGKSVKVSIPILAFTPKENTLDIAQSAIEEGAEIRLEDGLMELARQLF